jgi:hypothetical protein
MNTDLESLFPDGITDEAAKVVSDFLWQLVSDWDCRYLAQLLRYNDSRRPPCDPERPWRTLPPDR